MYQILLPRIYDRCGHRDKRGEENHHITKPYRSGVRSFCIYTGARFPLVVRERTLDISHSTLRARSSIRRRGEATAYMCKSSDLRLYDRSGAGKA